MKYFLYLSLLMFLNSCSHYSRLNEVLKLAGENQSELEKVLNHYQDSGLKFDAARFLIENMPGKYGIVAQNNDDKYKKFLENILTIHHNFYLIFPLYEEVF